MELFENDTHYIFVQDCYKLWCDKITGEFSIKSDSEWESANNPACMGMFYGIIGKIDETSLMQKRIFLIKDVATVGELYGNQKIYKIKSIVTLKFGGEYCDPGLLPCEKHRADKLSNYLTLPLNHAQDKKSLAKKWDTMKGTLRKKGKVLLDETDQAALSTPPAVSSVPKRIVNEEEEEETLEKLLFDELVSMFSETDSFFFCYDHDITSTLQRLHLYQSKLNINDFNDDATPLWKTADDRFFWNKHMLKDIIALNNIDANPWILPIIQGYIQIEKCKINLEYKGQPHYETFKMAIISRRSRFMAGVRFQRRGLDENGDCANYVETEQLLWYHDHQVSFVQVRGSVPIYWSQPGYKYKPSPRLDEDEAKTQKAFEKHFNQELYRYGPVCIVNLNEQSRNEKMISYAYNSHVNKLNNSEITYTTFDFYTYCRGMHFENLSTLISTLESAIGNMGYTWHDSQGSICYQNGIFRINCIDCLDRTNIAQTALAKVMIEIQLIKLGLIIPEGKLPINIREKFLSLWANNGNMISKLFAGITAIKGDYANAGARNLTDLIKDNVNKADRYYLNRFKDVHKQVVIDLMMGNAISADAFEEKTGEDYNAPTAIQIKLLIENFKRLLIIDKDTIYSSWGVVDADPVNGDPNEAEIDIILILTKDSYYVVNYDDQIDNVTYYQRVPLTNITMIETGHQKVKAETSKQKSQRCIRISYRVGLEDGYFHMFRGSNLRFIDNIAIIKKNKEESVNSICKAFSLAIDLGSLRNIPIHTNKSLEQRTSKIVKNKSSFGALDILSLSKLKYVSETQLRALKISGSKGLSIMSVY